jgi:hypothetical protein
MEGVNAGARRWLPLSAEAKRVRRRPYFRCYRPHLPEASPDRTSVARQPSDTGGTISLVPTPSLAALPRDSERNEVLNAISARWGRFSWQDLSELKTNDELVAQLIAKYGVERITAERDVDALLVCRSLMA